MYNVTITLVDGRIVEGKSQFPVSITGTGYVQGGPNGALTIYSPNIIGTVEATLVEQPAELITQ